MQEATPATERLQRDAFAPPPERGLGPAATLAVLVHIVLLLCLSWVVKWRDQPVIITAQAELWAKLPPQTESEPVPVPPPPPAEPAPQPAPPPPPPPPPAPAKPTPKAEPAPPPKLINEKSTAADIAEQKKKVTKLTDQGEKLAQEAEIARKQKEKDEAEAARKQKERDEAEAAARKQKEREEAEAAARKQKEREEAEAAARKQKEREEAEATARKQKEREEAEVTARKQKEKEEAEAAARKKKEKEDAEAAARKQKEKEEAARKERERSRKEQEDRLKKILEKEKQAEELKETREMIVKSVNIEIAAADNAGNLVAKISDKYAASIQAAIRPNITFTDAAVGNPAVEIHVKLAADGTILGSSIFNPSGTKTWDTAALRALDKTERLPRDENGRAPPMLVITLRPRER